MLNESEGSFKIYLQKIAQTPLLTPAEEIALADRIAKGDEQARTQMICANLRLVVKIAIDYSNFGVPVTDLISEGNIGLMKAVERFDSNRCGKLSTYAAWWIKQSIKRALANQSKTIRLPVHMVDKIATVRRIRILLTEALGREPTDNELAEEVGLPRQKLVLIKLASLRPTSLDSPVNESEVTEYRDTIADDRATSPLDDLVHTNLLGELDGLLDLLDERERRIIDVRFGLTGATPMTLEEVGRQFGVTRERIRQLQNSALMKMHKALRKKETDVEEDDKGTQKIKHKFSLSIEHSEKVRDLSDKLALVADAAKKNWHNHHGVQVFPITDDEELQKYKIALLERTDVQILIQWQKTKIQPRISLPEFWKAMEAIHCENERHSAAEILQSLIFYDRLQKKLESVGSLRSMKYLKEFLYPDKKVRMRRKL